jgi:7-keto-8-aminopelargonate synthetase-like enzyme
MNESNQQHPLTDDQVKRIRRLLRKNRLLPTKVMNAAEVIRLIQYFEMRQKQLLRRLSRAESRKNKPRSTNGTLKLNNGSSEDETKRIENLLKTHGLFRT